MRPRKPPKLKENWQRPKTARVCLEKPPNSGACRTNKKMPQTPSLEAPDFPIKNASETNPRNRPFPHTAFSIRRGAEQTKAFFLVFRRSCVPTSPRIPMLSSGARPRMRGRSARWTVTAPSVLSRGVCATTAARLGAFAFFRTTSTRHRADAGLRCPPRGRGITPSSD